MNQRFTLDRRSFEQFLAALSLVQQLKRQAAYRALNDSDQPFFSLLQLQRAINAGTVDLPLVMSNVVKLTKSVVGANAAGIWLFRNADEFSCCAQISSIYDPERLGADILARLADSNHPDLNSCAFSPTLRKASHYPGSPNSVAIAAVRVDEKIVGAVAAFASDFDAFSSRDLDNLQFLARLLEQALQKAMQAGYREAVALEHAAVVKLLEKIGLRLHELERQLSPPRQAPTPGYVEDCSTSLEHAVYRRLPQPVSSPAYFSEREDRAADHLQEAGAADISVPGVGVRAALGDVREFTGDESSSVLWQGMRGGSARARRLARKCRAGAFRLVTGIAGRMRNAAGHVIRIPASVAKRGSSLSFPRFRSITHAHESFAQIRHWRLKVRFLGLVRLHPSNWLCLDSPWLALEGSRWLCGLRSFVGKSRTVLNLGRNRLSYLVRFSKIQACFLRRELRQRKANLSVTIAQQRMRARAAQRRQKTVLTSTAEITGEALHYAGESLAGVASSTGHNTMTAFSTLKGRLINWRRPAVNLRALRRSAVAIGILATMAIFLALQANVRHSMEHVNAASASSGVVVPNVPAALAEMTVQSKPGPSSHLNITDSSIADTLHDLTRYEIVTLQRAAEYGDDEAAFQLGMAYETGYYVHQSCSKAAHWVKVAAEAGNSAAAYNLGLRYREGDGLQADESAAEHWLRTASSRQYSPAKLALAAVR